LLHTVEPMVPIEHPCLVEVALQLGGIIGEMKSQDYLPTSGLTHAFRLFDVLPGPHGRKDTSGRQVLLEFIVGSHVVDDHIISPALHSLLSVRGVLLMSPPQLLMSVSPLPLLITPMVPLGFMNL
jgi:hypothetical protein